MNLLYYWSQTAESGEVLWIPFQSSRATEDFITGATGSVGNTKNALLAHLSTPEIGKTRLRKTIEFSAISWNWKAACSKAWTWKSETPNRVSPGYDFLAFLDSESEYLKFKKLIPCLSIPVKNAISYTDKHQKNKVILTNKYTLKFSPKKKKDEKKGSHTIYVLYSKDTHNSHPIHTLTIKRQYKPALYQLPDMDKPINNIPV